jgi:chromosome segregation ATPase
MQENELLELRNLLTARRDALFAEHGYKGLVATLDKAIADVERERRVAHQKAHQQACEQERRKQARLDRDEEVKRLRGELQGLRDERSALQDQLAAARREIAERDRVIAGAQADKEDLKGHLADLREQLKGAADELNRVLREKSAAESVATEQARKLASQAEALRLLTAQLEEAKAAPAPAPEAHTETEPEADND